MTQKMLNCDLLAGAGSILNPKERKIISYWVLNVEKSLFLKLKRGDHSE